MYIYIRLNRKINILVSTYLMFNSLRAILSLIGNVLNNGENTDTSEGIIRSENKRGGEGSR